MPYKKRSELPPALAAFDPPLSLGQADDIAAQADAIGTDEKANGWAIAISSFKKSHKAEGNKWVAKSESEKEAESVRESWYDSDQPDIIDWSATSFAQYEQRVQADVVAESLRGILSVYKMLLSNIMFNPEVENRIEAFKALTDEMSAKLQSLLAAPPEAADLENAPAVEASAKVAETDTPEIEQLAETASGVIGMEEALAEAGKTDLLYLNVAVIQPGWGNQRDNNFYPREMLAQSSTRFNGAKMYETDHREDEKSTRTWVSTISEVVGFTEQGAPIARVAVHDPNFAQRVRNLNEAGLLNKMECSILAMGRATPGFEVDGRKGKRVDELTEVISVDWVTRAGAGGHAMNLAEAEAATESIATEGEQHEEQPEAIHEEADAQPITAVAPEKPIELSMDRVSELLQEVRLPPAAKDRLKRSYQSEEELNEAIQSEIAYIKEITGAGKPFAMGESAAPAQKVDLTEIERRKDAVNKKYLA